MYLHILPIDVIYLSLHSLQVTVPDPRFLHHRSVYVYSPRVQYQIILNNSLSTEHGFDVSIDAADRVFREVSQVLGSLAPGCYVGLPRPLHEGVHLFFEIDLHFRHPSLDPHVLSSYHNPNCPVGNIWHFAAHVVAEDRFVSMLDLSLVTSARS